jgi:hypothetical protein
MAEMAGMAGYSSAELAGMEALAESAVLEATAALAPLEVMAESAGLQEMAELAPLEVMAELAALDDSKSARLIGAPGRASPDAQVTGPV